MDILKVHEYALMQRPLLRKRAFFSDTTEMFMSPSEPNPWDTVTFRFRTAKNGADVVFLVINGQRVSMWRSKSVHGFDYYECRYKVDSAMQHFYYEVHLGHTHCFFNRKGTCHDLDEHFNFQVKPGFKTPDWAKGAVIYQIFVDRFCNGDPSNDVLSDEYSYIDNHVKKIDDWNAPIVGMDVRNFYGGDLQGIINKLDYLADLGVEAIFMNPIFVSPSNHKYDGQDYDYVDPHYGEIVDDVDGLLEWWDNDNTHAPKYINRVTNLKNLEASNRKLVELVEKAHEKGIKVIMDAVLNHCGSFHRWMDRSRIYEGKEGFEPGAYVSKDSPYHDYFKFYSDEWPYNGNYDGWWGHDTLPKLNYEASENLRNNILRIAKKWVSAPYNVDGWRLDVAADLGFSEETNHSFWRDFRKAVKSANPNALIVAEHYGDARGWLEGDQWDTVMNYDAFMEPVSWFFTGMEKHSDHYAHELIGNTDHFDGMMRHNMNMFQMPSLLTAMNQLDNHDHSRFLTRTNHYVGRVEHAGYQAADDNVDKAIMRQAVVLQMTWPGAPTLYYGDEAGMTGFTDPDNRRTYPWGREDKEMIRFHKSAIDIHKRYPCLRDGSLIMLYKDWDIMAYARFKEHERVVVVINKRLDMVELNIPVWMTGMSRKDGNLKMRYVFHTDAHGFNSNSGEISAAYGMLSLQMPPKSAGVIVSMDPYPWE